MANFGHYRAAFRDWRRHRPFWGGLFLELAAAELFVSANMNLNGLELQLGPQGFLSYVLPLMLLACGVLIWLTPDQRFFYGVVALLVALYSFLGLNLGGFGIGMALGIVGGGLTIAWRASPPAAEPPAPGPAAAESAAAHWPTATPSDTATRSDNATPSDTATPSADGARSADGDSAALPQDRPVRPATLEDAPIVPGFPERPGRSSKALALVSIPVVLAAVLVAGPGRPARAADCPEGLPSRSASASADASQVAQETRSESEAKRKKAAAAQASSSFSDKSDKSDKSGSSEGSGSDGSGSDGSGSDGSGSDGSGSDGSGSDGSGSDGSGSDGGDSAENPIAEGIQDLLDGLGRLLGINDDDTSPPSESPSPTPSGSSPSEEPTGSPAEPASPPVEPSGSAEPGDDSSAAAPSPSDAAEIPCLGARQYDKRANADDIPVVARKPGLMKVDSLTMYDSTYDGVVDMPTAGGGSFEALKFSMRKAVNKPFTLTVAERGSASTVITSDQLTTTGNVRFYTTEFKGKLFGLIPVTFTPEQPPPLTLPVLWFTDATIQLAYVRCDTLTGDPLKVTEKS